MSNLASVGEIIKELRKEKAYTQEELAKKINSTKATISKIETGKISPSLEVLTKIASELGTNISYILRDTIKDEDYQLAVIKSLIERVIRITTQKEYFRGKDSAVLDPGELIFSELDDTKNFLILQMDESLLAFFRNIAEAESLKPELEPQEYEYRISKALHELNKSKPGEKVSSYCLAPIQDIDSIIEKTVEKKVKILRTLDKVSEEEQVLNIKQRKPGRSN